MEIDTGVLKWRSIQLLDESEESLEFQTAQALDGPLGSSEVHVVAKIYSNVRKLDLMNHPSRLTFSSNQSSQSFVTRAFFIDCRTGGVIKRLDLDNSITESSYQILRHVEGRLSQIIHVG